MSNITNIFYTAVSWVLLRWHQLFSAIGLDKDGGITWALSIVFLVITARLLLFRFFVKQVHSQRAMQAMQPEMAKLKEKYKGDRAGLQAATMELQRETGVNPIAGCLPMVLQIPVFISLFHVLRHLANSAPRLDTYHLTLYGFTRSETLSAAKAKLFGEAPLAASFHDSSSQVTALGGHVGTLRLVAFILVLISAGATYITQRQVMKNAVTPPVGQAAMLQKGMLYFIPASVVFSGFIFPLGVLLYWFTSNLWTMGQQFYIFKYHPHVVPDAPTSELGKSLAPKPGAKPIVAPRSSGRSTVDMNKADAGNPGANKSATSTSPTSPSGRPAPGARPAGSNARNKRPAQQRKKRR